MTASTSAFEDPTSFCEKSFRIAAKSTFVEMWFFRTWARATFSTSSGVCE